jgi:RNA polymerase-binding transcription factor
MAAPHRCGHIHSGELQLKTPGLSKGFVDEQRKRLEARRAQLTTSSAVAAGPDRQDITSNGPPDTGDLGEIATERETDEALDRVTESRLRLVERALEKIAEGTYGLSDASGKPIPKKDWRTCGKLSTQSTNRERGNLARPMQREPERK